jgi:hypothetical protein
VNSWKQARVKAIVASQTLRLMVLVNIRVTSEERAGS